MKKTYKKVRLVICILAVLFLTGCGGKKGAVTLDDFQITEELVQGRNTSFLALALVNNSGQTVSFHGTAKAFGSNGETLAECELQRDEIYKDAPPVYGPKEVGVAIFMFPGTDQIGRIDKVDYDFSFAEEKPSTSALRYMQVTPAVLFFTDDIFTKDPPSSFEVTIKNRSYAQLEGVVVYGFIFDKSDHLLSVQSAYCANDEGVIPPLSKLTTQILMSDQEAHHASVYVSAKSCEGGDLIGFIRSKFRS